ncbi:MAG TPA: phosphatase PAP2 family protein [Anaeromyxobacteraceae bacterium]|nr:phosphatase PAP2 family protein [Anaeromyxobacteraceae bacterium]
MRGALRTLWKLRPEEAIALLFFPFCLGISLKAYLFCVSRGIPPGRFGVGLWRLAVTVAAVALFTWFVRRKPCWARLGWIRDVMPFLFCIAIYTNLNDTVQFVNPHHVHDALVRIDAWLFGVQPCVWAQRFYTPLATEAFSLAYMNYFVVSVAVVGYLLLAGRRSDMRQALLGTILCFYLGYALYVAFPAAPPRLVLAHLFTRDFSGGWLTTVQNKLVDLNPSAGRSAFPSLHCGITFITLAYAWRFQKALFAVLLPMGVMLVLATVYLRHHYVIDILAAIPLAVLAYRLAPPLEAWWSRQRERAESAAPAGAGAGPERAPAPAAAHAGVDGHATPPAAR